MSLLKYAFLFFAFTACSNTITSRQGKTGYDLSSPDARFILPDTLKEISGLALIDENTFACVQDENGILFIYDLHENKIRQQSTFNIDGDYEGICRVGNAMFILRSDGILFEIEDFTAAFSKLHMHETGIPANNNEGLCYDEEHDRLLIACKSNISKEPEYKDKRMIYAFDLKNKKLEKQPVFAIDVDSIKQFASTLDLDLPVREKKNGQIIEPIIKFRPSAISIHPVTKKLYLLSAVDHLLFIFNEDGSPELIEQLDPVLFNKAEGISFFPNGDVLITNEAQDQQPTLLFFRYSVN